MRRRASAAAVLATLLLAGCTPTPAPPATTPTATPPEPLTVVTTQVPRTWDPAGATTGADAIVALGVFSRLMVVWPEESELKPDLATDCLFRSARVYECELPPELTFHNGHALTASDVKFSIDRAYRLGVDGTSVSLLGALSRVEVVDDVTVRFSLAWADSQFGYALATPAASIVDEELYDPDTLRPTEGLPVGSGPYRLVTAAERELVFEPFEEYLGALGPGPRPVRLSLAADSAAAEQAIADGNAHAVWGGLMPSALERLDAEVAQSTGGRTKAGFARAAAEPVRVQRLLWNPDSAAVRRSDLRRVVSLSLQADRTLASVAPSGVTDVVRAFPTGGNPEVPAIKGARPKLTLSYASDGPGQADLARLLRDRLETNGGLSVLLQPDAPGADLRLSDDPAWVNTAWGWLQAYLDHPLPGSEGKLAELSRKARESTDPDVRTSLLAEIQQQAAADLTVLPVSQGVRSVFLADGVNQVEHPFGPAYQFGLWSLRT